MKRIVLAAAVLAIGTGIGIGSLAAQSGVSDKVIQRVKLMDQQGRALGTIGKMVRGQASYDQAAVDAAFTTLKDTSAKLPALYTADAKGRAPDADYYASDKVWENKAEFDQHFDDLQKAIAANAGKVKDLDTLKPAVMAIGKACGGCHEDFRVKKS
ncbi:cytochrome c, class II [Rhodovulum sp. PH10]|uniref:c-type cytochrome n=1 Tax=Rhodovulum sp. PH10 TaxID=1187851 RepID=UPI00027C1D79|nr:cytochrome c [Rhodovulum sp. PH10]EJW13641.1 cytochrome c, class II [Rhodovulum sp. PH10]